MDNQEKYYTPEIKEFYVGFKIKNKSELKILLYQAGIIE